MNFFFKKRSVTVLTVLTVVTVVTVLIPHAAT